MKNNILSICTFLAAMNVFSQNEKTLVTINKEKTTIADFKTHLRKEFRCYR